MRNSSKAIWQSLFLAVLLGSLVWAASRPWGAVPTPALFLDVWNGVYRTARLAKPVAEEQIAITGLSAPVTVYRDERSVPHIFAQNDADAAAALGYLTAKDRLFQLDFQTRVASGRLAEIFGADRIETDRYLRRTGMLLGAERTWDMICQTQPELKTILESYAHGVNLYIASLREKESAYPLEFRLLGYKPEPWKPLYTLLVNQLMAFDLTFQGQVDDVELAELHSIIGDSVFAELYPDHLPMNEPQSPEVRGVVNQEPLAKSIGKGSQKQDSDNVYPAASLGSTPLPTTFVREARRAIAALINARQQALDLYATPEDDKGSNNWVVAGSKTRSQKPLLAGDPHLSLSLPAIWYEAHISTPETNVYGVTIPGSPAIIVGFNDSLAWTPTNTGADVVDFYTITFENAKQQRYKHNGVWKNVEERVQTIRVKGGAGIPDTMRFTHWGPVITQDKKNFAVRWTAHEPATILEAIRGFNHAKNFKEFTEAQRKWDIPAQNIVYADHEGTIALRSCGYYPIRACGHGRWVHNGETDEGAWLRRVPFDSVPGSVNPVRGWLESANQEPVPPSYPYYLNYDWGDLFRAQRISEYLGASTGLTKDDFERFQGDVKVMQFGYIRPFLQSFALKAAINALNPAKKQAFAELLSWNGIATTDSKGTLLFHIFWQLLRKNTWDELPVDSSGALKYHAPADPVLAALLASKPESRWFDRVTTKERETAQILVEQTMLQALDSLTAQYGTQQDNWLWGKHHSIVIRHLTRSESLKALWRGPYPFPGFQATVLPAGRLMTTHSASWRMVVDFSGEHVAGHGVFPGGSSGNPFSAEYDANLKQWLEGRLYTLYKPKNMANTDPQRITQTLRLVVP